MKKKTLLDASKTLKNTTLSIGVRGRMMGEQYRLE